VRRTWFLLGALLIACSGRRDSGSHAREATPVVVPKPQVAVTPPVPAAPKTEPPRVRTLAATLTDAELVAKLKSDPQSLASMSIGQPNRGSLYNAIQMPESPLWRIAEPEHAWGTDESVASIVRAVSRVNEEYAATPLLYIGHLSSRRGGYLRPHRSHQSGRDADIGYYYSGGSGWYARATAKTLDRARTWALVKAFAADPNVEGIFIDRSVQALLREYALKAGEDAAFLDGIFESRAHKDRLIRHEWGHVTHLHVRFRCPIAEDAGIRAGRTVASMDPAPRAPHRAAQRTATRGRARSRS
jgi:murein endopeptidase